MTGELVVTAIYERVVERSLMKLVGGSAHRTRARQAIEITLEARVAGRAHLGHGEASPLPGYSVDSLVDVRADLADLRGGLPLRLVLDEDPVLAIERRCARFRPAARAALEAALLDLMGQLTHRPVWSLLRDSTPGVISIPLSAQILGGGTDVREEVVALQAAGFRTLKCKLDSGCAYERLEALPDLHGIDLRLDGNQGLSLAELTSIQPLVERLRPVLFEEPIEDDLATRLDSDEPALRGLPLGVDESLAAHSADEALAQLHRFDAALRNGRIAAVVIKPVRDGLFGALRLAQAAAAHGVAAIVTHTWDGPLGRLAAAHLALAVHRKDGPAHALTLPRELICAERSPADLVLEAAVDEARLLAFDRPGLGIAADDV